MLEQNFDKLIAAVERIAVAVEKLAPKDAPSSTPPATEPVEKKSTKIKKTARQPEIATPASSTSVDDQHLPDPEPADELDQGITYDEMHKVMFELVQSTPSAKKHILPLLKSYGYNHVQKVEPRHYAEIHGQLLNIATLIAKGEIE